MITVQEALERILSSLAPLAAEVVDIGEAMGRTLAQDIPATHTSPADDTSAMDGYAVRAADIESLPTSLKIIGEVPAGRPFTGQVSGGQVVRIFTGGIVPAGADTVVIQEHTSRDNNTVTILKAPAQGANIRKAGMDFAAGDMLVAAGKPLNERDIALISAANRGTVSVIRRPRVVLLATGDELVVPGADLKPGSVINTNVPTLAALLATAGAEVSSPGILKDDLAAIRAALEDAKDADMIVTLGGASVGDYDYVLNAFKAAGGTLDFWKIAMKPGKPLMFGALAGTPVVGLPGNPVSAYVTAFLFLLPALRALQGQAEVAPRSFPARAGAEVAATKDREVYSLGSLSFSQNDAAFIATPHPFQDSARISTLNVSDCLIHRPANAAAAAKGDVITVLPLPTL